MVMKRSQLAAACMVAVVCLPHAALGFATLPSSRSLSLVGSRAASMSPSASSSAFNLRSARVTRKSVTTAQMEAVQGAIDAVQVSLNVRAPCLEHCLFIVPVRCREITHRSLGSFPMVPLGVPGRFFIDGWHSMAVSTGQSDTVCVILCVCVCVYVCVCVRPCLLLHSMPDSMPDDGGLHA